MGEPIPAFGYDDPDAYHAAEEAHVGYLPMASAMLDAIRAHLERRPGWVLEFGAGTGLFTQRLVQMTRPEVLEPTEEALRVLERTIPAGCIDVIHRTEIGSLKRSGRYTVICSAFAHDHLKDAIGLAATLFRMLVPGGVYVCGIELLRVFEDEDDRMRALREWHDYVIGIAESEGNVLTADLERQALRSGLDRLYDFKTSESNYEASLVGAGFGLVAKQRMTEERHPDIGGVFCYVWRKPR